MMPEASTPDRPSSRRFERVSKTHRMRFTNSARQSERSREDRDEQPENMPERLMSVEASQPDKRRDRRDEQSENMPPLEFEEDMKFVT